MGRKYWLKVEKEELPAAMLKKKHANVIMFTIELCCGAHSIQSIVSVPRGPFNTCAAVETLKLKALVQGDDGGRSSTSELLLLLLLP